MKNQVMLRIFGKDYKLATEDTPEYSQKLAETLNEKLRSTVAGTSELSHLDGAMLVALDCLDEAVKARMNIDNIRSQIKDYVDDAEVAKKSYDAAQKELAFLRDKVAQLEREVALRKELSTSDSTARGYNGNVPNAQNNLLGKL